MPILNCSDEVLISKPSLKFTGVGMVEQESAGCAYLVRSNNSETSLFSGKASYFYLDATPITKQLFYWLTVSITIIFLTAK